ncbi:MAG: undecaprenyl-diphosphate phosphatase [Thermoleophilaceae bacterium]
MSRVLGRPGTGAALTAARAATLGALHGPLELLPVSSSAHLILLPRMLGWPYDGLPAAQRKAFEVAVHLGTAAGLGLALRREVAVGLRDVGLRRTGEALLALGPPVAVGAALGAIIEERASSPRSVAVTQVLAGLALAAADRAPTVRRRLEPRDHLAAGLAQAAALVPGVSRGGAVLTAGRARRLSRSAAARLARESGGPVIVAAACREVARLARGGVPGDLAAAFAAGAAASFVSAAACAPLAYALDGLPSWRSFGVYRVAFGLFALWRLGSADGAAPAEAPPQVGTEALAAAPAPWGSMGR